MKKIINHPDAFVDETIEGILCAYPDRLKAVDGDLRALARADCVQPGKVGIVTGGGSGHLPTFLGYVGAGMLDACAVGNVFASPSAQVMYKCIREADRGAGVLCLYGNYGGDTMNFEMACEMAEMDGIQVRQIRVSDDVASAPAEQADRRRGVAGLILAYKIAGAAADLMMSLHEVVDVTRRALANIRSMGVAVSPCTLPQIGKPTFFIAENEIEVGMGIHGEPGIEVREMMTADDIVNLLLEKIMPEIGLDEGDEAVLLLNSLGATPMEELFICYRRSHQLLGQRGVRLHTPFIGEFATSMEMAGISITLFKLADSALKRLLLHPAATPFFTNLNRI